MSTDANRMAVQSADAIRRSPRRDPRPRSSNHCTAVPLWQIATRYFSIAFRADRLTGERRL